MRRVVTAVLVALCVAGCGSPGRPVAARAVLDFGPPVEAFAGRATAMIGVEVRAPAWVDSPGISYRLLYADPQRLFDYTETRWAGAPALLVGQRLRQRLRLLSAGAGHCNIVVELDEFSQVFDAPTSSRGVLRGNLTLLDRRGAALGRLSLATEAAAPSADARGGVAALALAVDLAARQLQALLDDAAGTGQLKPCGT